MNHDLAVTALLDSLALALPEALLVLGACVLFVGGTFRSSRDLWGVAALVTLALAGGAVLLTWPSVPAGTVDQARITGLIEQLKGSDAAEREEAFRELERIGAPALPLLRPEADSSIPEVQAQARKLVARIEAPVFGSTLHQDRLALFIKVVALAAGVVLVLVSWKELPDRQAAESFACLLVITAGLGLVGTANDLVTLFLALELISIPSYVLLYLPRFDNAAQEAAMKYFLLSVFTSALLLLGFSYLYGLAGTTNLPALADALGRAGGSGLPLVALAALVLVVAGLGFKITAVPFHFYAPDVYQGTATSNAAVLAFMPKAAGFVALVRVLAFVPPEVITAQGSALIETGVRQPGLILGKDGLPLLWILSAVTMTLGNVLALLQDNVKRLLAYSSVAHAGYMLIGLAVAAMAGGQAVDPVGGVEAVLFYLVAYGAMTVGAFGVLVYLSTPERPVETVDDLAGLSRSHPGVALLMALFLFSLIGIPLTAGFMGKLFLFLGAMGVTAEGADVAMEARLFRLLALVGALNAAVAAWYYLRLVTVMYLRSPFRPLENRRFLPGLAALALCALVTLGFGVNPRPLLRAVQNAVPGPADLGTVLPPAVGPR